MSGTRGFTLVEVLAGLMIVVVLGILLVPAMTRSSRHDKVIACSENLKAMHQAHLTYLSAAKPGSAPLGSAFWVALTRTSPPLIGPDRLRCPLVDHPAAPDCQYMGPPKDPATIGPEDPLGCDLEPNHSANGKQGGNILLKSGQVLTDHTGMWASSIQGGKCKP